MLYVRWLVVLLVVGVVGCNSDDSKRDTGPGVTGVTATPQRTRVLQKLAAIDNSQVKLGAELNRTMLRVQVQSFGFNESESVCIAGTIEKKLGTAFESATIAGLSANPSLSPESLLPCSTPQRLTELTKNAKGPDFSKVNQNDLRQVLTKWFGAGYERAGLTSAEAVCLSQAIVSALPQDQLGAAFKGGASASIALDQSLDGCVTQQRQLELAG